MNSSFREQLIDWANCLSKQLIVDEYCLTGEYKGRLAAIHKLLALHGYIYPNQLDKIINPRNRYREAILDYYHLRQLKNGCWVAYCSREVNKR